ncbi:hypothetical protein CPLU01_10225 [Colletotrichum plurivorum]|uniref:Uncharacterized protein n=1 Tax=Colletotrichum plurivorum TaxID=2175906 RepID=A0A8H6N9N5_9PEZI|nr:hypothetical protein CPLU01_10225 [Colletotrichum plurivorum]
MATKTYILTPNFTYKPTGSIQIGSIITDPFRPAKSLSQPAVPPAVETVGRDKTDSIFVERLETRYLAQEPADNDPELTMRLKEPRVRAAIKAGIYGRAPVYLISGVKIARGLTVRSETGHIVGGGVGLTVPAAQAVGLNVGADVGGERGQGTMESFTNGDEDVLIAYQVHVLKAKGSKAKERVMADVFESDASFLHDDKDTMGNEDEENFVEVHTAGVEELAEVARQAEITVDSERAVGTDDQLAVETK